MEHLARKINHEFPDCCAIEIKDQYYNMREKIEPLMHIIDTAEQAMRDSGVTPKVVPIRGGTDGAQLSFKGLPCPNIFAGGLNFHGRYEYVPIPSMEKPQKSSSKSPASLPKPVVDTYTHPGGTAIIITGATGSGKTSLAIELARHLHCHIISADSRQIYRDIPITTAAPTPAQLAAVPHHLVGILPLDATYSAAQFVQDVHTLLPQLWQDSPYVIICGGSMMYLHALLHGIDDMPTITEEIRTHVLDLYHDTDYNTFWTCSPHSTHNTAPPSTRPIHAA